MSSPQENSLDPRYERAMELILAVCNERIDAKEAAELEELVRNDAGIRRLYIRMLHLHASLYEYAAALGEGATPGSEQDLLSEDEAQLTLNETMVLPALSDVQLQADEFDDAPIQLLPLPPRRQDRNAADARSARRRLLYGAAIAALVMLCLAVAVLVRRQNGTGETAMDSQRSQHSIAQPSLAVKVTPEPQTPPPVATIGATIAASWEPGAGPPESGKVPLGTSLRLRSGCVQLDWAAGGETIIEGPAFIELASRRELFLGHGNVAANVPGGGFVVRTPSGVMTDLGTRFGVAVQPDGTTQVDVFEGAVQAVVHSSAAAPMTNGPTTGPTAQPLMLSAGKAASLAGGTVTLDQGGAMPQRFITRLSSDVSQLDVVDLVCGGDGSTHRRGEALDPVTGKYGELKPVGARSAEKSFHRIAGLPVIDGVFVPNGSRGPTLIDSARDLFSFPATTGIIVNHIWTGGAIPWFHSPAIRTDIAGVDYSQLPHGILCIHSNGGLTFNLANIRRLYPGRSLARFHCTVGNSYVNGTLNETGFNPRADVYVIVDGKVRQERRQFTNQDGVFTIDVPLQKTDRFMSLATTDGGDDINDDWVLWLDPQIQLGN